MPQKKFRMLVSSKNTQTTANHRFNAERKKNPKFQMNAGCCGNRNPLIGWRKEILCCSGGKLNNYGYQTVLKNVQDCCKPPQLKMIQNRAGGVSGAIDRNYNYNYRQYLKKRCMIADYDNRSGARQKKAVDSDKPRSVSGLQAPCCTDCSGTKDAPNAFKLYYKRSNWNFYREGAVDNGLYIANRKIFANPCCAGKLEESPTDPTILIKQYLVCSHYIQVGARIYYGSAAAAVGVASYHFCQNKYYIDWRNSPAHWQFPDGGLVKDVQSNLTTVQGIGLFQIINSILTDDILTVYLKLDWDQVGQWGVWMYEMKFSITTKAIIKVLETRMDQSIIELNYELHSTNCSQCLIGNAE